MLSGSSARRAAAMTVDAAALISVSSPMPPRIIDVNPPGWEPRREAPMKAPIE